MYLNNWQQNMEHRQAQVEIKLWGKPRGPDGTAASREKWQAKQAEEAKDTNAPAPYKQPRAGVNRAAKP